jgi:hypothetical protein
MKTRRIFAVRGLFVTGISPVHLVISQNSGKDKPPSIDAKNAPNEHGHARDAASVTHDMTHAAQNPLT